MSEERVCGECSYYGQHVLQNWGRCVAPIPVVALRYPGEEERMDTDVFIRDTKAQQCQAFKRKEDNR
jgi:hypothetical protein